MLQRYILVWLVLSSGLSLFWPRLQLDFDPFLMLKPAMNWLIVTAMFCVGALLPHDELRQLARRWPVVLLGTAAQYISMPLLAWLAVLVFRPEPELATGIIIVGCVPGAMASNVLTMTARGNVSYSVSLTTCSTLLSPIVVPQALRVFLDRDVNYNGQDAVMMLILQVALPVIAGHGLSRVSQQFQRFADSSASVVANLAILTVIAVAVALKRGEVGNASAGVIVPLLVINVLGYLAGFAFGYVGKLNSSMKRALTLEVGMQNAGAGTVLAVQLFGEQSAAIIPCVLYTFGCMLTGTILATVWNHMPIDDVPEKFA